MPVIESDIVERILRDTAQAEILPRFRALQDHEVREKGPGDLVTVADEATEAALHRRLSDLLPGSVVVGEEAAAKDAAVFDLLEGVEPVWVIDPVDGTGNFARGRETFAVMVALVRGGETRQAWIYLPVIDAMLRAEAGSGAELDGQALRLAEPADPTPAQLRGTLHAGAFATPEMARRIERRRGRVGQVRSLSCAGGEYLRLARGEIDFSLFTKLMPWDHAPGTLIVTEAGGQARLLDGTPYRPTVRRGDGLLMAPDPASWHALYETLLGQA
jgi:fructose-1,6-bisphosphatase/inositol monophosphatase family enzyme